jgi:hypothetical protein
VARPVVIRVSYNADVAHLLRLSEACGRDNRQSASWKREEVRLNRLYVQHLMKAVQDPVGSKRESEKKPDGNKK